MRALRKLKSRAGFSLGEMLVTIIILMLVSTIITTGIPAAQNAFDRIVVSSNARVMLSTAITALRDELATAQRIQVSDDGSSITYYSIDRGTNTTLSKYKPEGAAPEVGIPEGAVVLQEYQDYSDENGIFKLLNQTVAAETRANVRQLLSTSSDLVANQGLYVTFDSIGKTLTETDGKLTEITITGLKVMRKSDGKIMADMRTMDQTLKIRIVSSRAEFTPGAAGEEEEGGGD